MSCARNQSETDVSGASIPRGALGFTRRSLLRRFLTSTIRPNQKFSTCPSPSAPQPELQEAVPNSLSGMERSQESLFVAIVGSLTTRPHPADDEISHADDGEE